MAEDYTAVNEAIAELQKTIGGWGKPYKTPQWRIEWRQREAEKARLEMEKTEKTK